MRAITLRQGAFGTLKILAEVLQVPGPAGVNVEEMRERLRLLELIEAAEGSAVLELDNADYQTMAQLVQNFRFGMITRELIDTVDGILQSPPPSRPRLAS